MNLAAASKHGLLIGNTVDIIHKPVKKQANKSFFFFKNNS